MTKVDVVNLSTVVPDDQVVRAVAALEKQVQRDFAPIWGTYSGYRFIPKGEKPHPGHRLIGLFDDADVAGVLGYHDRTPAGLPIGKVFVKTTMADGGIWTVTLSHEALEMEADPDINLTVLDGDRLWAYEVCDACEADKFGYEIDGVLVSDFVTPAFFEPSRDGQPVEFGTFDFKGHIGKPLSLLEGGYLAYLDIKAAAGWQQLTAREGHAQTAPIPRPAVGSRRERRRTDRALWDRSTYATDAAPPSAP